MPLARTQAEPGLLPSGSRRRIARDTVNSDEEHGSGMTSRPGSGELLWAGRYSQSLKHGLGMLRVFSAERPSFGIADLADELGLSRPTTHRYAVTLVRLGFLEQLPSRRYRLAARAANVGMSVLNATGLREHSRVQLEFLRRDTTLTASLALLDGAEIVYVDRAGSRRGGESELGCQVRVGSRLPAYCTALGKVLLANVAVSELDSVLSGVAFAKRAPNTITTKDALVEALGTIREQGFAVSDEECAAGEIAIAVPVRLKSGEVPAAVGLVARKGTVSMDVLVGDCVSRLVSGADRLAAGLDEVGQIRGSGDGEA